MESKIRKLENEIKDMKKELTELTKFIVTLQDALLRSHVNNSKSIRDITSRQHRHGDAIANAGLFK